MSGTKNTRTREHKNARKQEKLDSRFRGNDTSEGQANPQINISQQILLWARGNDWYRIDTQTNQLRLEQTFAPAIELIVCELNGHNQHLMSRKIYDLYDLLLAKCRKIDLVCRAGCRTKEEMLELELLRVRIVGLSCELAEAMELVASYSNCQWSIVDCKLPENKKNDTSSGSVQANDDEWITFTQAAQILAISKPTLTRWADEGKITCNGKKTRLRKLSKVSVLLQKQLIEDEAVKQDIREIREDAKRLTTENLP